LHSLCEVDEIEDGMRTNKILVLEVMVFIYLVTDYLQMILIVQSCRLISGEQPKRKKMENFIA